VPFIIYPPHACSLLNSEAVKNKDWNTFGSVLTDDFVLVSDMKANLNLRDYSMEDVKVKELGKETALLTYILRQKDSQRGKGFSSQDYLSAVYVNRGGKWLCVFAQFTPVN
jgi:hypothetical protein